MDTKYSDRANAIALKKNQDALRGEAQAFTDDETLDPLVVGFHLAMDLVRMGALSRYIGADLKVWAVVAKGHSATAYFVAAKEEELLARLEALPNA